MALSCVGRAVVLGAASPRFQTRCVPKETPRSPRWDETHVGEIAPPRVPRPALPSRLLTGRFLLLLGHRRLELVWVFDEPIFAPLGTPLSPDAADAADAAAGWGGAAASAATMSVSVTPAASSVGTQVSAPVTADSISGRTLRLSFGALELRPVRLLDTDGSWSLAVRKLLPFGSCC